MRSEKRTTPGVGVLVAVVAAAGLTVAPAVMQAPEVWTFVYREWQGRPGDVDASAIQVSDPYTSEAACRAAGRALMPHERRFWPPDEQAAAAAADRAAMENRHLRIDALLAEAMAKPDYRPGAPIPIAGEAGCDDVLIFVDANGKPDRARGGYKLSACRRRAQHPAYDVVEFCTKQPTP